jgi:hypothetical protein
MFQSIKNFFTSLFSPKAQITDNKGNRVSGEYFDQLRGAHSGRDAENMQFSRNLFVNRFNKPTHETFETGHAPGADPIVTNLEGKSSEFISNLLKTESGTYYSGRIKTYFWTHKRKEYFACLAEMIYFDRQYRSFIHAWQGPNPASGFHSARTKIMSIVGDIPKIKGTNFEENT